MLNKSHLLNPRRILYLHFVFIYFIQNGFLSYFNFLNSVYLKAQDRQDLIGTVTFLSLLPYMLKVLVGIFSDHFRKPKLFAGIGIGIQSFGLFLLIFFTPKDHLIAFIFIFIFLFFGLSLYDTTTDAIAIRTSYSVEQESSSQNFMNIGNALGNLLVVGILGIVYKFFGWSSVFISLSLISLIPLITLFFIDLKKIKRNDFAKENNLKFFEVDFNENNNENNDENNENNDENNENNDENNENNDENNENNENNDENNENNENNEIGLESLPTFPETVKILEPPTLKVLKKKTESIFTVKSLKILFTKKTIYFTIYSILFGYTSYGFASLLYPYLSEKNFFEDSKEKQKDLVTTDTFIATIQAIGLLLGGILAKISFSKLNYYQASVFGPFLMALSTLSLLLVYNYYIVWPIYFFLGISWGFRTTSFLTLAMHFVTEKVLAGTHFSFYMAFANIGIGFGGLLNNTIRDKFGYEIAFISVAFINIFSIINAYFAFDQPNFSKLLEFSGEIQKVSVIEISDESEDENELVALEE